MAGINFANLFLIILITKSDISAAGYDDLENFISPGDIDIFLKNESTTIMPPLDDSYDNNNETFFNAPENETAPGEPTPVIDCFGFGRMTSKLRWILNLKPQKSNEILVEFYFSSRKQRKRVQVVPGDQFGLEWVFYNPNNPTIVIVHGFLSYSKASWVINMTNAFLDWADVNVITVDWSRGGNTWKYWRAVANTRTVGSDLAEFLKQLMNSTGTKTKDFHFVGHSLGAHICSFAANRLGGVRRITGLDPAQPCFITTNLSMLLDKSDADFVDVIHTNGRVLSKLGLGVPNTCGDQDFYPNGGMKQPGCHIGKSSYFTRWIPISYARIQKAMCNHGRAYLLFTESLKDHSCSLMGYKWNLSYTGVNASMHIECSLDSCAELGIRSEKSSARGSFYVITTSEQPYCDTSTIKIEDRLFLLSDIEEKTATNMQKIISSTENPKKKKGWFNFGK